MNERGNQSGNGGRGTEEENRREGMPVARVMSEVHESLDEGLHEEEGAEVDDAAPSGSATSTSPRHNNNNEWDDLVDLLAPSRALPDNINLATAPSLDLLEAEELSYRSCEVAHIPHHRERMIENTQRAACEGLPLPSQNPFLKDPFHKDYDFESEFDHFPGDALWPMLDQAHKESGGDVKAKAKASGSKGQNSASFPVLPEAPWRVEHTHVALPSALTREQVVERVDASLESVGVHVVSYQEPIAKWVAATYVQSELVLFRVRVYTRPAGRVEGVDFPETIVELQRDGGSGLCFHTLWRAVRPILEGGRSKQQQRGDAAAFAAAASMASNMPTRPTLFKALPMQSRVENLDPVAEMLDVSKGDVGAQREAAQILANVADAEHSAVRLKLGLDPDHKLRDGSKVKVTLGVSARALELALPLLNVADGLSVDADTLKAKELRETARAAAMTVEMACRTSALALENAACNPDSVTVVDSDKCLAAGGSAIRSIACLLCKGVCFRCTQNPRESMVMVAAYDADDMDVAANEKLCGQVLSLRAKERPGVMGAEQSAAVRETRRCCAAAVACLSKAFPALVKEEEGLVEHLKASVGPKCDGGDKWLSKYARAALTAVEAL